MPRLALCLALFLGLLPALGQAQGVRDVEALRAAVAQAAAGDWTGAEAAVAGRGGIVRDLVRWLRLRAGEEGGAPFEAYRAFLAARPHWPGLDRVRMRGEAAIPPDAAPESVIAFFDGARPQTGEGAAALGRALLAAGRAEEARAVAADAWLGLGLTEAGQAALLAAFADTLAPLHWQRAEAMLWRRRTTDAARMLPLLPADRRLLAEARIALIRGDADRGARIAAVPPALRDDPGLACDRFTRLAEDGDYSDAVAILAERSVSAEALGQPSRWASWRATLARWTMREGRPREAYALASRHFLTEGESFAELEWIAGYVALRQLGDPATALTHFRRMEAAVTGPISVARAAYWVGRAQEAAGEAGLAADSYGRAALYQSTFYGLLAAERLGRALDPALAAPETWPDWRESDLLRSDLTAAMLMLVAAEDRTSAALFALKLTQTLDRDGVGRLGTMLTEMGEAFLALTVGKEAQAARGWTLPAFLFPLHPLATEPLPVEAALALAIARQESAFNPAAGSPVGALGLMQLMPATAEEVAGELGLPYARARLTSDWRYNAILGTRYLANLEATFGPSPVMIAAGYNAGPSRPRTWMTQRGDPRTGEADVIDWIEHIPFAETRTYVMRVTESIPAYRARLTGQTGPVRFLEILNGARPLIRPQGRPWGGQGRAAAAATDASATQAPPAPPAPATALAPVAALRPVARP